MRRISLLTNSFPPTLGGAEKQAEMLARDLADRGVSVEVLTRVPPRAHEPEETPYTVHRAGRTSLSYAASALARCLTGPRPESFLAWSLDAPAVVGLAAKLLRGSPLLVRLPGGVPEIEARRRTLRWKVMLRLVDGWIAVTRGAAHALEAAGVPPGRIHTITNAVPAHRGRGVAGSAPLVLYLGRLEPIKGVDVLLRAWPEVRRRHPDAVLRIVGDGSLHAAVWESECPGLEIVGATHEVERHLEEASLLVVPSRAEGCCNAVLEAFAAGLPVVATDVGGNPELVRDGVEGLLVPSEDPASLAEALDRLLTDGSLRARMGRAARARSERHAPHETVSRYLDLLEEVRREAA